MRCCTLLFVSCAYLSGQPARDLSLTVTDVGGAKSYHLRNQYSSPATAWILMCETDKGGSRYHWDDQELGLEPKPIDPGKEIEFKIPPRPAMMVQQTGDSSTCDDFRLAAAIFADGTVTGDLRWISAVVSDRRKAYQDLAKASGILEDTVKAGTPPAEATQKLNAWRDGERGMPRRNSPSAGGSNGWSSRGTDPPRFSFLGPLAASATLWLIQDQQKSLPDAIKLLGEWRDRLAKLVPVTSAEGPFPSSPVTRLQTPVPQPDLVGKPAPDFTLKDVDGHEVALKSLRGKFVLLSFWGTWCPPCREEMPHIKSLYDEFKDRCLVVVCVAVNDTADKTRKYFEDQKLPFLNLLDDERDVSTKYGAGGVPRVILIDKEGAVHYFHRGWGPRMDLRPEVVKLVDSAQ